MYSTASVVTYDSLYFFFSEWGPPGPAQGLDPINTLRQHFWDPLGPRGTQLGPSFKNA